MRPLENQKLRNFKRCPRLLLLADSERGRVTVQCRRADGHDGRHTGNTGSLQLTWRRTDEVQP